MDAATNPNDEPARADAVASGGAYAGVVSHGGRMVWSCPHIHFTEHSARACALRQLERGDASAGKADGGGGTPAAAI